MRNRFISDWVYEKTGKRRTAKQVGSHLQRFRDVSGGKQRECPTLYETQINYSLSQCLTFSRPTVVVLLYRLRPRMRMPQTRRTLLLRASGIAASSLALKRFQKTSATSISYQTIYLPPLSTAEGKPPLGCRPTRPSPRSGPGQSMATRSSGRPVSLAICGTSTRLSFFPQEKRFLRSRTLASTLTSVSSSQRPPP